MPERKLIGPRDPGPGPRRRFGRMGVTDTDQFRGRHYRCACGWTGWSSWGHAADHAKACPRSDEVPSGFRAID